MIIEIALGIVLAVLILRFLPQIIALGITALVFAAGFGVFVGLVFWFPNVFLSVLVLAYLALIAWIFWATDRVSKKENEKDAHDLQQGQGRSETGLTWIEPVSDAERNKGALQALLIGGGLSALLMAGAELRWWWGPLAGLGMIGLPLSVWAAAYSKLRRTRRCGATSPKKVFVFLNGRLNTPEALEEGHQRGWW